MLLSEQDIALAWIGVSDPIALGGNFKDSEHVKNFAANLEAAILAKLAAKELPEPQSYPADCFMREVNVCDALAVSIAIQQAYEQGAAAQLGLEPLGYFDDEGNFEDSYKNWMKDDSGAGWQAVYTRREA